MSRLGGICLTFALGFAALASEILWYRGYAFAFRGHAQVFGILLGGYLFGISLGAVLVYLHRDRAGRVMPWLIAMASVTGYALVPILAVVRHTTSSVIVATALSVGPAAAFGALFPLVCDAVVRTRSQAGMAVGHLYAANIAGCTLGSLLTGLILLDWLTVKDLSLAVALVQLATAAAVVPLVIAPARARGVAWTAFGLAAGAMFLTTPVIYKDIYARLMDPMFSPIAFRQVIENRVGVIGVTDQLVVFGDGVYDGVINVDLRHNETNGIHRAYLIGALHPAPRHVLMIGLSTGSWATVVAANPLVEDLTIVEINPGYLQLIEAFPAVSGLLRNPKVHIEIDDGRRWLERRQNAKFDMIIANTVYHWRANAARLLSTEFLQLVRRHLAPGGVYYYNSTESERAVMTGLSQFPHGWRIHNMVAVSDRPFVVDLDKFRRQVLEYRLDGQPVLSTSRDDDRQLLDTLVDGVANVLEPRDRVLEKTQSLRLITDDNMGSEWEVPQRYRVF